MVSAPRSRIEWASFVGLVVALYVGIILVNTDAGLLSALTTGALAGLSMAIPVALLVVLWRGVPDLLFPDDVEAAER